jgi:hypothetical protein
MKPSIFETFQKGTYTENPVRLGTIGAITLEASGALGFGCISIYVRESYNGDFNEEPEIWASFQIFKYKRGKI